jgi:3-methyladenine DNA glycosylase AlkD
MPTAASILRELKGMGSQKNLDGMARFGIVSTKAYGISVGDLRKRARTIGRDHELAADLWKSGWFEARMLAVLIDVPAELTSRQMDAWAKDFDNWAICDTACFHLFDKTPMAWKKIDEWSTRPEEFVKRASFALLASVALHDKKEVDKPFVSSFKLIERAADDDRNFVKKGVSWALRGIGHRNDALRAAAIATAERLTTSDDTTARWIGRDTLRDLRRPPRIRKKS